MKIYLSGQITGNPNYKKDFEWARAAILKAGLVKDDIDERTGGKNIINPAGFGDKEDFKKLEYFQQLDLCLWWVMDCDAICLLPNFNNSKGAKAELAYARAIGKKILWLLEDGRIEDITNTIQGINLGDESDD